MKRKITIATLLISLLLQTIPLTGCSAHSRKASGSGVYFDTVVDILIYDDDADRLLAECFTLCDQMEDIFSAQKEGSELYRLNHRTEASVTVSDELASCIKQGLYYGELSNGAFDITILPLRELWSFESEDPKVPSPEAIKEALKKMDYRKVHCEANTVTFDDPEIMIDLGGIAKGYISGYLKQYLKDSGCTSAIINLGGNVSTIGSKPDGSSWTVGIQEPFADRGTVFEKTEISDACLVSSGVYERYFTQDGKQYHHILDPHTGYPAETALEQASVEGYDDVLCDAFSTICILVGRDEAIRLIEDNGLSLNIFFVDSSHKGEWYRV